MRPLRASFAAAVLLVAAALLLAPRCSAPERKKPTHVVVILVDTLRADHLHAWGYARETSPALDRLASQGVRFERAISQTSWTSPSVVSLFTSRYLADDRRLHLPADLPALAEIFKRAGWATGAFVGNVLINEENGFRRGFDRFEHIDDYGSDDAIVQWIREHAGKPTLTYVHLNEPHDPYLPPEGQRAFRDGPVALPPETLAYYREFAAQMGLAHLDHDLEAIAREIAGYDDDVRAADRRVASVLDALEQSGQAATSAVLVTADHGEGLWTHVALFNGQRGTKLAKGEPPDLLNTLMPTHGNQVHRELVHVPMLLRAPGLKAGTVVLDPVENVDVLPTLLELCDISSPGGLQGASLLPLVAQKGSKPFGFSHTHFVSSVITAEGLQLLQPTELGRCAENLEPELYDLNDDPDARSNLASKRPEIVALLSKLVTERLSVGLVGEDSPIDDANLERLRNLGYLDDKIVEPVERERFRHELEKLTTEALLALFFDKTCACPTRVQIAAVLGSRDIDDAARAKLSTHLSAEHSNALRAELERALAAR